MNMLVRVKGLREWGLEGKEKVEYISDYPRDTTINRRHVIFSQQIEENIVHVKCVENCEFHVEGTIELFEGE